MDNKNLPTNESAELVNNEEAVKNDEPIIEDTSGYAEVKPVTATYISTEETPEDDVEFDNELDDTEDNTPVNIDKDLEDDSVILTANTEKVPKEKNVIDSLKNYGITDDEAIQVLDLIQEYIYNGHDAKGMYDKLPVSMKNTVDGLVANGIVGKDSSLHTLRKRATELLMDEFVNDASLSDAVDEYNEEMAKAVEETNTEYSRYFKEAMDETFSHIDDIEAENPEQAEQIRKVKKGFEEAENFDRVENELKKYHSYKKLHKQASRFNNEAAYVNKKVNTTSVKIANMKDLFGAIRNALQDEEKYSDDIIIDFLTLMCKSMYTLDVNNNIADLAYIYKLTSNIGALKFIDINNADESTVKFVERMAEVIDHIKSL